MRGSLMMGGTANASSTSLRRSVSGSTSASTTSLAYIPGIPGALGGPPMSSRRSTTTTRRSQIAPQQSPFELADTEGIFAYYDTDGDGRLTEEQFLGALQAGGACTGLVEFDEVCKGYGRTPDLVTYQDALKAELDRRPPVDQLFRNFPALDQDGRVHPDVLKYVVTTFGMRMDLGQVDELIGLAEFNEYGTIDVHRLAEALAPPGSKTSSSGPLYSARASISQQVSPRLSVC